MFVLFQSIRFTTTTVRNRYQLIVNVSNFNVIEQIAQNETKTNGNEYTISHLNIIYIMCFENFEVVCIFRVHDKNSVYFNIEPVFDLYRV